MLSDCMTWHHKWALYLKTGAVLKFSQMPSEIILKPLNYVRTGYLLFYSDPQRHQLLDPLVFEM